MNILDLDAHKMKLINAFSIIKIKLIKIIKIIKIIKQKNVKVKRDARPRYMGKNRNVLLR